MQVAGEVDPTLIQWCAVYDAVTGAVVHLHEHIALERSGRRSEKDLARDAMAEVAAQHDAARLAVARLAVAHPKGGAALQRGVRYRVGLDDREIRAERRPRPKPRSST